MNPRISLVSFASVIVLALVPRTAMADATHTCVEAAHEGQRLRDAGSLSASRPMFVQCSAPACPALVRESCERWAEEIDARLPTVVFGARDEAGNDLSQVRVAIDGKPLLQQLDGRSIAVDPGPHELVFEAAGFAPIRQFLVVREGERVRSVVAVFPKATPTVAPPNEPASPPATPSRNLTPHFLAGGAGVLGFAGFAVFGLWGKGDRDRLAETCAPTRTCSSADVHGVQTKYVVADVSLLVGIIGTGVLAAYLIAPLFKSEPSPKQTGMSVGTSPMRGGFFGAVSYAY